MNIKSISPGAHKNAHNGPVRPLDGGKNSDPLWMTTLDREKGHLPKI